MKEKYTPFRFAKATSFSRCAMGGRGLAAWCSGIELFPCTRYLLRCAVSENDDVLVFSSLMENEVYYERSALSLDATLGVAKVADPRLQFVIRPTDKVRGEWSVAESERNFDFGDTRVEDPGSQVNTDLAYQGHKLGGVPHLNQPIGEIIDDIRALMRDGFGLFLQIGALSNKDDIPPDAKLFETENWIFAGANLLIWTRLGKNGGWEFRYAFN